MTQALSNLSIPFDMRKLLLLLALLLAAPGAWAQTVVTNDITTNTTWTADNEYELDGLIFVNDGATLTIEPGTRIYARRQSEISTASGDGASALIVRRGGKIMAEGTANAPIVFTTTADDGTLEPTDRGEWGGLILLGKATNNQPGGEEQIEGIDADTDEATYGCDTDGDPNAGSNVACDDEDNSGTLRYVSIRHGGFSISGVEGDEINGLTLGSVGAGTTIEYVEVYANLDDCVEWFGGTVSVRYLVGAFCGDDTFDYDQGWRGKGQFWLSIQASDIAGRAGEHDGGDDGGDDAEPKSLPTISHVTYIGAGASATPSNDDGGAPALKIRDAAGGKYYNFIITEFPGGGVDVEDLSGGAVDSRQRMADGELVLSTGVWFGFSPNNDLSTIAPQDFVQAHLQANNNTIADPGLTIGAGRTAESFALDMRPAADGPAASGATTLGDAFFWPRDYVGAFDPNGGLWTDYWSALWERGHTIEPEAVVITDDISSDVTWTADKTYLLDGLVFVNDGATLTINAGTIIKARRQSEITSGDGASALIVRRGGKIMAEGTANAPIIFTTTADDVFDMEDLEPTDRGEWGGLILLGKATNNQPGGEEQIEGIDADTDEATYGCDTDGDPNAGSNVACDDEDNSGTLRYVSIRHGGFSISGVEGDEINGLTLGSVGAGTTIEYVEVYANLDDCVEWFGGTVSVRYLVGAFCGDDTFDYDQGWRGKGQFWLSIQASDIAGRAGEHDGGDDGGDDAEPKSLPTISHVTYIGAGASATPSNDDGGAPALKIRDAAGGKYYNFIITEFPGGGVDVEDLSGGAVDSRQRMADGELVLSTGVWFGFSPNNDLSTIAPQDFVQAHLQANNNTIADPMLIGISREVASFGLDPRPGFGSPARSGATTLSDDFFWDRAYLGAFNPNAPLWTDGWSALSQNGISSAMQTDVEADVSELPQQVTLEGNYPNPFNPTTTLAFTLNQPQPVRLAVYDVLGREVAVLVDGVMTAGRHEATFEAAHLASGMYLYQLQTSSQVLTRTMMLVK